MLAAIKKITHMNTKRFFEDIQSKLTEQIKTVNDSSLSRQNFVQELIDKFSVVTPKIQKKDSTVNLGQEIITFDNAPPGISFTRGHKMDYALFSFPVDNYRLFAQILDFYPWDRNINHSPAQIYYKELSQFTIEGNDKVIDSIKLNAKSKIESLEKLLVDFDKEVNTFNSGLETIIKQEIKKETEKRNLKKDTENKLKPF